MIPKKQLQYKTITGYLEQCKRFYAIRTLLISVNISFIVITRQTCACEVCAI